MHSIFRSTKDEAMTPFRARSAAAALAAFALLLCAPKAEAAEKLKVVTTFTVLADMAANVAGDAADIASITRPGAEVHGYQPTPRDMLRAHDADLILRNGLNLELWFERFLRNLGDVPSATLSEGIDPIPIGEGGYAGKANPHAWMGLSGALVYIDNIRAALAAADPANAEVYAANAAAYAERLKATLRPLQARIAAIPETRRWLVTCEGAFSYLARDFGMKELYLWPMNADQNGTPRQVKKVIDGVRAHQIPAVFCESTVNTAPAEQVARETGARYGGVLYVDSVTGPEGPAPSYLDLLRVTAETVADGLAPQE